MFILIMLSEFAFLVIFPFLYVSAAGNAIRMFLSRRPKTVYHQTTSLRICRKGNGPVDFYPLLMVSCC